MGVFTTAARTWGATEILTATNLNAQLRDLINGFGAWTSYTPTWTASVTNPVLGNGTLTGAYAQVGKVVWFRIFLTMGSSTTFGSGAYSLTLPVTTPSPAYLPVATATINVGSALYLGTGYIVSTTALSLLTQPTAGASATVGDGTLSWASGNKLAVTGMCESV